MNVGIVEVLLLAVALAVIIAIIAVVVRVVWIFARILRAANIIIENHEKQQAGQTQQD